MNTLNSKKVEIGIYTIVIFFRIWLGQYLGAWLPAEQIHDDALMVNYADLYSHYISKDLPEQINMVKEMIYPLFLNIVHWSGLDYSLVVTIIWIIASFLVLKLCRNFIENKKILFLIFLFVLFTPSAFDLWLGTRVYRNAIIAPVTLIVFSLLLILDCNLLFNKKNNIVTAIFLGLFFFVSYYIKEDGIWILACLLFNDVIIIIVNLLINFKKEKKHILIKKELYMLGIFCIPLAIHFGCTHIYKSVNEYYYGVYETNTRTEGELGDFVKNIYKIDSNDRTPEIWAPYDSIKKAFKVSPTLKQYPELLQCIEQSPWVSGNISENPISGDFLTWIIRDALVDADIWKNEKQIQKLFSKVNDELEEAFKNGILEKENKIQLVSSMGGRSVSEICQLKDVIIEEYKSLLFLKGYEPGGTLTQSEVENVNDEASFYANMDLHPLSEKLAVKREKEITVINNIVKIIFKTYSIIYPIMCLLAVLGVIVTFVRQMMLWMNKHKINIIKMALWFMTVSTTGISFAYTLSIGWFSSFLDRNSWPTVLKFYSVGAIPLMILIEVVGSYLFISEIIEIRKEYVEKHY